MPRSLNADDAAQLSLFALPEVVSLGDGSYRVIPRKPVAKASVSDAARMTGAKRDNLYKLIEAGMVEYERPSPRKVLVILESLRAHLEASRQPGFWTAAKIAAYHGRK